MAILDNRTPINAADAVTDWTNVAGVAAGTLDNDTFIEGSGSVTFNLTSAVAGLLYNIGTTIDLTGNHIYVWFNCAIAGKLNTKAAGGVRLRFAGPTASDFFEVFVAGSDTYTGGWKMFVVDVDAAAAAPDATGGTPPAKTAIQRVGLVGDTNGFMSKKVDNFWVDAIWRLPANTPGILVEGENTGPVAWAWADILSAAVAGGWGSCVPGPGGAFVINTPIRFGANDAVVHRFSDSNVIILWDDQPVAATLYGLQIVGGSSAQSFLAGVKTGTGDDATGGQGWVVAADADGARWYLDADDANIDVCQLYGCVFQHGSDFELDRSSNETISCQFVDCTSARVDNSLFLRCNIIDANTGDGAPFLTTDDLGDVRFCSFEFSDGHGVMLTTTLVTPQTSKGNTFTGYGGTPGSNPTESSGSNDAAIYNNAGGAVTINVTTLGSTPSVRNGSGATTVVNSNVAVTVTPLATGSEVRVYLTGTSTEVDGTESSTGSSFTFSVGSGVAVDVVVLNYDPPKIPVRIQNVSFSADQNLNPFQRDDANFANPD
jgi:hypothetical protein